MAAYNNRDAQKTIVYRKTIDPELTSGTAFDGVQPGDLVAIRMAHTAEVIKPVFIVDITGKSSYDLKALVVIKDQGLKIIEEKDVQGVKLTGDQNSAGVKALRHAQGELLKTRKSIEAVSKQIAPLVADLARLKLKLKNVERGLDDDLKKL